MEKQRNNGGIDMSDWKSIEECVENALETGNHEAFADFFICNAKVKFMRELFFYEFEKKLGNYKEKLKRCEDDNGESYELIASRCWRNPCFSLDINHKQLNDKDYKKYINFKRGKIIFLKKKFSIIKKKLKSFSCKKVLNRDIISESIKKWCEGDRYPGKDELVQVGLCLGWGVDDVNELLELQGQRQLDPVDIIDAIGMYYLEELKKEGFSAREKLSTVKSKINAYVKAIGMRQINVSKTPIGYNSVSDINDEIAKLREKINVNENINDTDFVMYYVKSKLDKAIEEKNFDSFFSDVKDVVAIKQYGYLRKTLQFIDEYEKYEKNLYYRATGFSTNISKEQIEEVLNYKNEGNPNYNRIWDIDNTLVEGEGVCRDYKLRVLKAIWGLGELMEVKCESQDKKKFWVIKGLGKRMGSVTNYDSYFLSHSVIKGLGEQIGKAEEVRLPYANSGTVFAIKNLILGRVKDINNLEETRENDPYIISNDNILTLMKFAIAAGKEDELGRYLILSGHKKDNLNTMIEQVGDEIKVWEKTDALIIYCLRFRDRLIEEWSKKYPEDYRTYFKIDAKKKFPMIQLIMEVSEKIQDKYEYKIYKNDYSYCKVSRLLYPIK